MKHWAVLCMAALALAACKDSGGDDKALSREELLKPESCKDCHPKHYREWSASMHAYSMKDPVFIAMNKRGQEETKGELGEFCVKCHAPMAVHEKAFANGDYADLDQVPDHLRGVTCYFCHNVEDVGKDHFNNPLVLADDTKMRGGIEDPVQPTAHIAAFSPHFDRNDLKSSELCGSCHDIVTPAPASVHLERTYSEYQMSFFANAPADRGRDTCAGCHMHGVTGVAANYEGVGNRQVHEHLWAGVDVALDDFPHRDAMNAAVASCALPSASISFFDIQPTDFVPGEFSVEVTLETSAGHAQPSGAAQDRRMWLELTALDASDKVIYQSGNIADDEVEEKPEDDPKHDPSLWQFRERMFDASGKEVHMFWEAASVDHKGTDPLPVGISVTPGSHSLTRGYRIGQVPAKIQLRLRMRPIGLDVLDNLIASGHLDPKFRAAMQTFTVFTGEGVFHDNDDGKGVRFVLKNTTEDDCNEHVCLLDPDADGCDERAKM